MWQPGSLLTSDKMWASNIRMSNTYMTRLAFCLGLGGGDSFGLELQHLNNLLLQVTGLEERKSC